MTAAADGLRITGSDVPVRRDDADVVCGAAHMKLGDLLFVKIGCSIARTC
jgi:hypothetical protein